MKGGNHSKLGNQGDREDKVLADMELTLAARVHTAEDLAQLLGLDPASGGELPSPLEHQEQGWVLLYLLFTASAPGPTLGLKRVV